MLPTNDPAALMSNESTPDGRPFIDGPLAAPLFGEIAGWDVRIDPATQATGWPRWREDAQVREPPMMSGAENTAHAKAVQDFRTCYQELCAADDAWKLILQKKRNAIRFTAADHTEAGRVLDVILSIGPQLQNLIAAIHPTESAAIPGWFDWHTSRIDAATAKASALQAAADEAQAKANTAKTYLSGLQTAIAWLRFHAPMRGVQLTPAPQSEATAPNKPGFATINENTPGLPAAMEVTGSHML